MLQLLGFSGKLAFPTYSRSVVEGERGRNVVVVLRLIMKITEKKNTEKASLRFRIRCVCYMNWYLSANQRGDWIKMLFHVFTFESSEFN